MSLGDTPHDAVYASAPTSNVAHADPALGWIVLGAIVVALLIGYGIGRLDLRL